MTQRPIKSAERTLRLFELFSRRQTRLTVTEIARGLAIPQPSASMLLANLVELGYLERSRVGRSYAPTIRLAFLGGWTAPAYLGDARTLAARLDELQRSVDEDIYLGIQNGASAQIVQLQGANAPLNIDSGQMYSLTRSAIGQVLLAAKPDAELRPLVRRCNAEAESRHRVHEGEFLALIGDVRRKGYAWTSGYLSPERGSLAVCIPSPAGGMDIGLGCSGPLDRFEAKRPLILEGLRRFQRAAPDCGSARLTTELELSC